MNFANIFILFSFLSFSSLLIASDQLKPNQTRNQCIRSNTKDMNAAAKRIFVVLCVEKPFRKDRI